MRRTLHTLGIIGILVALMPSTALAQEQFPCLVPPVYLLERSRPDTMEIRIRTEAPNEILTASIVSVKYGTARITRPPGIGVTEVTITAKRDKDAPINKRLQVEIAFTDRCGTGGRVFEAPLPANPTIQTKGKQNEEGGSTSAPRPSQPDQEPKRGHRP